MCPYMALMTVGFLSGEALASTGALTRLPIIGAEAGYPSAGMRWEALSNALVSGPLEELALVGIPVLLLGRGRTLVWLCAILAALLHRRTRGLRGS